MYVADAQVFPIFECLDELKKAVGLYNIHPWVLLFMAL